MRTHDTHDCASSNAIDDALERLDRAAQRMADQAEAQLAARRMRNAGVPIGRPDDLLSETLAAVSPGAAPSDGERDESRRFVRTTCLACEETHSPDEQCADREPWLECQTCGGSGGGDGYFRCGSCGGRGSVRNQAWQDERDAAEADHAYDRMKDERAEREAGER